MLPKARRLLCRPGRECVHETFRARGRMGVTTRARPRRSPRGPRLAHGDRRWGAVLRLCGALGWFWLSHAHLVEGARRLETALGGPRPTPAHERGLSPLRASSWAARGGRTRQRAPITRPSSRGRASLTTSSSRMRWMSSAGFSSMYANDEPAALAAFEESLSVSTVASVTAAGRPARSSASAKSW